MTSTVPENRRKPQLHWPVFTVLHSSAQLFMVIWVCWNAGVTTFGLAPEHCVRLEPLSLKGPIYINHTHYPNPWFGPSLDELIHYGAIYPPCIRTDYRYVFAMASRRTSREDTKLGCCEHPTMNIAATITENECRSAVTSNNTRNWKPTPCSRRPIGENFVAQVIRPCCASMENECFMTSPQHCWFLQGTYHYHADHCSQVDCLRLRCSYDEAIKYQEYNQLFGLPSNYNQWWRFMSATYVPQGLIDGVVMTMIAFPFGVFLEKKIGWLRMSLIHTTAGAGGHMIGSLLASSTSLTTGAGPSVAGTLTVTFISQIKDWKQVTKPFRAVSTCVFALIVVVFLGTFPRINIFSIFGGLVLGFLSSFIYLPYPKTAKYFCCSVIVFILLICLFIFYEVQSNCTSCQWFGCGLYSQRWCE